MIRGSFGGGEGGGFGPPRISDPQTAYHTNEVSRHLWIFVDMPPITYPEIDVNTFPDREGSNVPLYPEYPTAGAEMTPYPDTPMHTPHPERVEESNTVQKSTADEEEPKKGCRKYWSKFAASIHWGIYQVSFHTPNRYHARSIGAMKGTRAAAGPVGGAHVFGIIV